MTNLRNIHRNFFLVLVPLWNYNVFVTSCQVYPLEYAYKSISVYTNDRRSANCRAYPVGSNLESIHEDDYTHCDGSQLRLADSDLGSEQFSSSDYFEWNDRSNSQLLFIFPTRVNLTTITLHYYSDRDRGLPRLRFYAVPNDFNIWDAPAASYSCVGISAVPPGGEQAGRMKVSTDLNFTTTRVLLYKYDSHFALVLSEVEFFSCNGTESMVENMTTTYSSTTMMKTTTATSIMHSETTAVFTADVANSSNADQTTTQAERHTANDKIAPTDLKIIIIGIVTATVILLSLLVIAAMVLLLFMRKSAQRKANYDSPYATLCRESVQQMQLQSLHTYNDLYDQIQLSPSTGQAELISTNETANTNNPPLHQNEYGIHPSVHKDKPKSVKLKITASTISTQDEDKSTSKQPTYAVVNKRKKQKTEKESVHCQNQITADQNIEVAEQNVVEESNQPKQSQDGQETATQIPSNTVEPPQELYTAVKKKPKARPPNDEEDVPPIPPYTVEELYTAVQKKPNASTKENNNATPIPPHPIEELNTAVTKKPRVSTSQDKEEAPPIPAHTVEELYTAVSKKKTKATSEENKHATPVQPHTMEELYTAVKKMPKVSTQQAEEEAPPIPAHTVVELYTAVQKKSKVNTTEDEEEAPPVPPHTLD